MSDVILGAGISGLGAYWGNENAEIYEKEAYAGGLCSNFEINGFRFDKAVHLSFTNEPEIRKVFDREKYYTYNPYPCSWKDGIWFKHPVQNNLFPLPAEEKVAAIKSFIQKSDNENIENFEAWLLDQYGQYMYENFFKKYNEKYWCMDLAKMDIQWIENRIYKPSLEEILYGSYTDKTDNTYYAKEMRYPKQGGYITFVKQIIEAAEQREKIHYNKSVCRISVKDKRIYFLDGESVCYSMLYSSLPITDVIECIDEAPGELKEKSKCLEHTGMALVSIGFNKKINFNKLWFYIYDKDIFASRAYMPSVKAEDNVPKGCSSIQFEIYFNAKNEPLEKELCIENCLYALEKMQIAKKEDVLFSDYRVVNYGNVIFTKETKQIVEEIACWLKSNDIVPIGRFGKWKYLWSDQAFLSGYEAIRNGNKEEL